MRLVLLMMSLILMSGNVWADSVKKIQYENCLSQRANACINNRCALPSDISEDKDCQDICHKEAKILCKDNASPYPVSDNVIDIN